MSHPSWVRGLKLEQMSGKSMKNKSHPSWVRGLKHNEKIVKKKQLQVAPLVGAWIETLVCYYYSHNIESHPSWVRGLKQRI